MEGRWGRGNIGGIEAGGDRGGIKAPEIEPQGETWITVALDKCFTG